MSQLLQIHGTELRPFQLISGVPYVAFTIFELSLDVYATAKRFQLRPIKNQGPSTESRETQATRFLSDLSGLLHMEKTRQLQLPPENWPAGCNEESRAAVKDASGMPVVVWLNTKFRCPHFDRYLRQSARSE